MITFGRDDVREALADADERSCPPVVALETAALTHGLPRPCNLKTLVSMEEAVRDSGAVPAVIGVVRGELVIGLDRDQLESLANAEDVEKASSRDLPYVIASGRSAGTTVAATLIACGRAGIRVLATGGIGGVHRAWVERPDISADLEALARTACLVVSAGVKSVLDVPATLEALEALGVPVFGYRCDAFPQFFSLGTSEVPVPRRVDDLDVMARLLRVHWGTLGQAGGALLANPVPRESAMAHEDMEQRIDAALEEARTQGVHGAALTPFLLDHVARGAQARSLHANVALLEANARLGAEAAVALAGAD